MNNNNKIIFVIIVLFPLLFALSACTQKEVPDPVSSEVSSETSSEVSGEPVSSEPAPSSPEVVSESASSVNSVTESKSASSKVESKAVASSSKPVAKSNNENKASIKTMEASDFDKSKMTIKELAVVNSDARLPTEGLAAVRNIAYVHDIFYKSGGYLTTYQETTYRGVVRTVEVPAGVQVVDELPQNPALGDCVIKGDVVYAYMIMRGFVWNRGESSSRLVVEPDWNIWNDIKRIVSTDDSKALPKPITYCSYCGVSDANGYTGCGCKIDDPMNFCYFCGAGVDQYKKCVGCYTRWKECTCVDIKLVRDEVVSTTR